MRFEDRDEDDAPAPPGAATKPAAEDGGAALRRALSRNTIVPQQVYDGAPSSDGATSGSGSSGATPAAEGATPAASGAPSAVADAPAATAAGAAAPGPAAGSAAAEALPLARSGLPRAPSRENLPATAFPSSIQGHPRCASWQLLFGSFCFAAERAHLVVDTCGEISPMKGSTDRCKREIPSQG